MSKGSKQRPTDKDKFNANFDRIFGSKSEIIGEWDESVAPPKRPKFIQEMFNEGERVQDEAEKRIANFMLEGKK